MQAEAEAQAQPQATNAPRKAKKITSEVLAGQLLRALTESQSTTQQIMNDKLEFTTLVQGLGKTELNAPHLSKFTKDTWVKFVELYDIYHQKGRDSMVELIVPSSLGYAAYLCKMTKEELRGTSNEEFSEIMNKKFAVDNATGHKKILQSFAMTKCAIQGFSRQNVETYMNDFMTKITC